RPELREVRLPGLDHILRRRVRADERHGEGLLEEPTEAAVRRAQPPSADVRVPRTGHVIGLELLDGLRPVGVIACHVALRYAFAAATAASSVSWMPIASSRRVSSKICL